MKLVFLYSAFHSVVPLRISAFRFPLRCFAFGASAFALQRNSQTPQAEETRDQDGHARGIVPRRYGRHAFARRDPDKKGHPREIEKKRQRKAGEYAKPPAQPTQHIKFAEKQRDHQCRLERSDAAACLVNTHHPRRHLDDVAVRHGGNAEPAEQFRCEPESSGSILESTAFQPATARERPREKSRREKQNLKRRNLGTLNAMVNSTPHPRPSPPAPLPI